jgi:ATP-binding cassette subfamily F protein 3
VLSVENITVEFGASPLFDEISFLVNAKERIALVGKNGAGKTTLLRLIHDCKGVARNAPAEIATGRISIPKDLTIGYLPQTMVHAPGTTVMQESEKAFEHITALQVDIEQMNAELAERTD